MYISRIRVGVIRLSRESSFSFFPLLFINLANLMKFEYLLQTYTDVEMILFMKLNIFPLKLHNVRVFKIL